MRFAQRQDDYEHFWLFITSFSCRYCIKKKRHQSLREIHNFYEKQKSKQKNRVNAAVTVSMSYDCCDVTKDNISNYISPRTYEGFISSFLSLK